MQYLKTTHGTDKTQLPSVTSNLHPLLMQARLFQTTRAQLNTFLIDSINQQQIYL